MIKEKIAVITVNYKNYKVTEEFIQCFKTQSDSNFKVFISDLTENPKDISKNEFVQVIFGKNKGYAYGINLGIREAISQGFEKFIIINNDVNLKQDFVENAIKSLSHNPSSILTGKIYYEKGYEYHKSYDKKDLGNVIWYAGGKNDWSNVYTSHIGVDMVDKGQFSQKKETDFITGCLMIFSKQVVDKVGLMDESYFLYYEDADYCERAKNKNIKLIFDPSLKIWHKNSQSTEGSGSSIHVKYQTKNRIKFGLKYAPFKTKIHLYKELIFGNSWILISFLIFFFIFIRSINFVDHLNFSGDQATHSATARELFDNKKITLIGNPITSTVYDGRMIFQGPLVYYMYMFFQILGGWDPIYASYVFMIFCALMIIPLFFGIKKMFGFRFALVVCTIYTLMPYYVNYTRFLWNPNFQLSLIPVLVLLLSYLSEKKNKFVLFILSVYLGLLLQLHYQFILVIIGIFIYYFLYKKLGVFNFFVFFIGILIGISPIIIFELRHGFYNINTVLLMMSHWGEVQKAGNWNTPHYHLSTSLMLLIFVLGFFSKHLNKIKENIFLYFYSIIFVILFLYSAITFFPKPTHGFWSMVDNWYYKDEYKIYQIIKNENLKNFNVVNLLYDAKSKVIIYFLKRDGFTENWDDYYHEKYLFVVDFKDNFMNRPVYEVKEFNPSVIIKKWQINENGVKLFLLKRI